MPFVRRAWASRLPISDLPTPEPPWTATTARWCGDAASTGSSASHRAGKMPAALATCDSSIRT